MNSATANISYSSGLSCSIFHSLLHTINKNLLNLLCKLSIISCFDISVEIVYLSLLYSPSAQVLIYIDKELFWLKYMEADLREISVAR